MLLFNRRRQLPLIVIGLALAAGSARGAEAENRAVVTTPGGRRIETTRLAPAAPKSRYLVAKFSGRVNTRARAALGAAGYREITYLPDDALLLRRSGAIGAVNGIAVEGIAGWAAYLPEDRLSRELTSESLAARADTDGIPVMIHLMPGESDAPLRAWLARHALPVLGAGKAGDWGRVVTLLPPEFAAHRAGELAAREELFFIERIHRIGLLNDRSVGTVQSGVQGFAAAQTPIYNQGIRGEGQVIGVLDTGVDADSCYYRDTVLGLPQTNTWSAGGGYGTAVNNAHRKIVAYDFLNSCDQYPGRTGCDLPATATDWDDHGHGTHVSGNALGDNYASPVTHDAGDGVAPAAKLVVQDGGFGTDNCGDIPGLGCPMIDLYPVFQQSFTQGARLHNNSYGDNENAGAPGQSNYSARSQDVDRFTWNNKDMLIIFAAGNSGTNDVDFSAGSPSTNKNGLSVGSTRTAPTATSDENMSSFSSRGWAGDGRIKPDIMAPGNNVSAGNNGSVASQNCTTDSGGGTSYAAPTLMGAGALARQYFTDGFYPTGARVPANALTPTAALLRAALINSAVSMTGTDTSGGPDSIITPIPSNEQGWGRVRLDRALFFTGGARKLFVDDHRTGVAAGATAPFTYTASAVTAGQPLKVTLAWSDYPSNPDSPPAAPTVGNPASWSAPRLVNDFDLTVSGPAGTFRGNVFATGASTTGGSADRRNNLEQVLINAPTAGTYTITVTPFNIVQGPQDFALLATGDWSSLTGCTAAAPSGVNAAAGGANRIDVSWSAAGGATSYKIFRALAAAGPYSQVGTVTAPTTTFANTPVSGGVTYFYVVRAVFGCDSPDSNVASASTSGACTQAPAFAGLASVSDGAQSTCTLQLSWSAAALYCAGPATYRVYRSTSPGFTPSVANRIATGVSGTNYSDASGLINGTTYYYVVRAVDGPGNEEANTVDRSTAPGGPLTTIFSDNAGDSGSALMTQQATWAVAVTGGAAGPRVYQTGTYAANACIALTSPVFNLPAGTKTLSFASRYDIENSWDKGIVEISTNGGGAWSKLTTVNYPGNSTNTGDGCALGVTGASFTGTNNSYATYTGSLSTFTSANSMIRFRLSSDVSVQGTGWRVDDILVQAASACTACSAAPAMSTVTGVKSGANLVKSWPVVAGAASYRVYRETNANVATWSSPAVATGLTGLTWTDVNQLANSTSQFYSVTDVNSCGAESPK